MFVSPTDKEQDNTRFTQVPTKDFVRIKQDSVQKSFSGLTHMPAESKKSAGGTNDAVKEVVYPVRFLNDTLCRRNNVTDVTFYDSTNFINTLKIPGSDRTILVLAEKSRVKEAVYRETLVRHLKEGKEMPVRQAGGDWVVLVIIAATFLFSTVRINTGTAQPLLKFFLFRGINDSDSRDTGGLFHWQSTVLNLISFIVISIFGYEIASVSNSIPSGIPGILVWLLILGAVISAFTLRNAVCAVTGNLSGQKEAFSQYLVTINQYYHFTALILFFPVVFISYAAILPASIFLTTGIAIIGVMYLLRVIRLLIIFLNRNISIFYLILYLCALEILPVAIAIKYFTGLA